MTKQDFHHWALIHAMQGLLAGGGYSADSDFVPKAALEMADALTKAARFEEVSDGE